ncbi:MAG: hypothetical protein HUJ80_02725 [Firmicutes bacterium]|nr:hypothetical protein [Bacillota bacterium]
MNVIGFSGKSGSGKSFISTELCGRKGADAMIDDGLLICRGNIIAGRSAKKQATLMGAVKTAIFTDEEHRSQVAEAIQASNIQCLMVLGTSDKMVDQICDRLAIDRPSEYIHIEDVATPEQIEKARRRRELSGTHVIPAPTMQVKRQFSGYFLDPRKGFRKKGSPASGEKTIVRPTFSYMGEFEISDKAIADIVMLAAGQIEGIADVVWVASDNSDEGMYLRIILRCKYGTPVRQAAYELQKQACDMIASMTAFNVLGIEAEVREFSMKSEKSFY